MRKGGKLAAIRTARGRDQNARYAATRTRRTCTPNACPRAAGVLKSGDGDLDLRQVLLLDRVQKHRGISGEEAKPLKQANLIEGRAPNFHVSAKVAAWTGDKARYIRNRGFDDQYYRGLVLEFLQKYGQASRRDLDELLLSKLPDVLDAAQKGNKVRNLLQAMRREGLIRREGPKATAVWHLGPSSFSP